MKTRNTNNPNTLPIAMSIDCLAIPSDKIGKCAMEYLLFTGNLKQAFQNHREFWDDSRFYKASKRINILLSFLILISLPNRKGLIKSGARERNNVVVFISCDL